jgi:hypothetical protein
MNFLRRPDVYIKVCLTLYCCNTSQELTALQNMFLWHSLVVEDLTMLAIEQMRKQIEIMNVTCCTLKYVLIRITVFIRFGRWTPSQ